MHLPLLCMCLSAHERALVRVRAYMRANVRVRMRACECVRARVRVRVCECA